LTARSLNAQERLRPVAGYGIGVPPDRRRRTLEEEIGSIMSMHEPSVSHPRTKRASGRAFDLIHRIRALLSLVLHHAAAPVATALVYYVAIVPLGLGLRAFGKDMLLLRLDPVVPTYWIKRDPPGPARGTMTKQS
jgi:hypothetical protein